MSTLGEVLVSYKTDRRLFEYPVFDLASISEEWNPACARNNYLTEYTVKCTLGSSFSVSESSICSGENGIVSQLVKRSKQEIIEAVFGEFRNPLLRARKAAMNRDYENVIKQIELIYDEMFKLP